MVLVGGLVFVLVAQIGFRCRWPGTAPARTWWHGHRRELFAFVRGSPATFIYLAILVVTTWVLQDTSPQLRLALLRDQSTNLHHLQHDPMHVLVRSAFWVADARALLVWSVLFIAVLAPAERWLGTARWIGAMAAGHIGATLLTAVGIWVAIRTGTASHHLENVIDVGVSYGLSAVAALFAYRLPGRWGWLWAGSLVLWVVSSIVIDGSFTSYGHATALAIGFALYPLTLAPAVRSRAEGPIIRLS